MPTGYTAGIEDGKITTLADYALLCARAFGATIMQRDDPTADLPKLRAEESHHAKELAKSVRHLAIIEAMTEGDTEAAAKAEYTKANREYEESSAKRREELARYDALRKQVNAWQPPTPDHVELKKFMLQQIEVSTQRWYTPKPPKKHTGAEWRQEQIASTTWSINYHTEGKAKEEERNAGANDWIRALYKSVGRELPEPVL
jgi:hypothetical protein